MYKIINTKSIEEEILKLNGLSLIDIDVSNFKIDTNLEVLNNFKRHIEEYKDKSFFIVGDYDFDGLSSTAIICRLLNELKIKHNYYIPSRIKEGYGINDSIVDKAIEYNFDVLLLLDNGIVAYEQVSKAKENGLEVMIIDHHEYTSLPEADCIIHPSLLNDEYEDACTAGLCYLLSKCFYEDDYSLVLAGIASLADMVKVLKYNRYIIKQALQELNTGNYPNINLLNKKKEYSYQDLSFNVIPKINAISRLGYNANKVVSYFLSDGKSAYNVINDIEVINNERKALTSSMNKTANTLLDDSKILVITDPSFNEGLCGIVSARLTNSFNKPSIVLSESDGILKGSARSTNTFNLYAFLNDIKDIFISFGGHEKALGLSLYKSDLVKLLDYINSSDIELLEEEKPALELDPNCIDLSMINVLDKLAPFGNGLNEPLFIIKNNNYRKYYVSNSYPKFVINNNCEAILFDSSRDKDQFRYIVGKLQKDGYHKDKVSFLIDDLVV